MSKLEKYGITNYKKELPGEIRGRVIKDFGRSWVVITEAGECLAQITGKMRHESDDIPVIGDWVLLTSLPLSPGNKGELPATTIKALIPRKSHISRNRAGKETAQQVMAANIDLLFIVFSLEGGRQISSGGIERYVTLGWNSGAIPYLLLNKTDLASPEELASALGMAEEAAPGVDIIMTSCLNSEGITEIADLMAPGKTCALIGPSGVGKSSLINAIAGKDLMKTGEIREKEKKGSHTTTHRELLLLPGGGCMIDTPGLRELQLWGEKEALEKTFSDVEEIAVSCRFRDCSHLGEPGCAVQTALAEGALTHRRYENYLDLQKELAYLKRKTDVQARKEESDKWKQIHMSLRKFNKGRRQ